MGFCSKCGAQLNAGAGFCGACGAPVAQSAAPAPGATPPPAQSGAASSGLDDNVAGALCYILGIITGIIFLVIEPYKNNRFVRFHAFQSVFFWVACAALWIVVGMLVSIGGWGMLGLFGSIFWLIRLAMFAAWIFLMYKAYNKEMFKLPVIGDIAAKQAGV